MHFRFIEIFSRCYLERLLSQNVGINCDNLCLELYHIEVCYFRTLMSSRHTAKSFLLIKKKTLARSLLMLNTMGYVNNCLCLPQPLCNTKLHNSPLFINLKSNYLPSPFIFVFPRQQLAQLFIFLLI